MTLKEIILSDYRRIGGGRSIVKATFCALKGSHRGFTYIYWLRVASHGRGLLGLIGRIHRRRLSRRYSVDITPQTSIGPGFYIGHGCCIVVSPHTVIGANVNLSQMVNIGTNDGRGAIIGDAVYIGPQCCVVGAVNIGAEATIGAGSVVTRDITAGATAVGSPAREIHRDNPGRYVGNRWQP